MRLKNGLMSALAMLTMLAMQQSSFGASVPQVPNAIRMAEKAGVKMDTHFAAASGLTGWVMQRGEVYRIVYTTADGKTMLMGALIDQEGHNLSAGYYKKYVPKPDFTAAYKRLEHTRYIVAGTKSAPKAMLYVFMDPNCIFCHLTWEELKPYEKVGLQVRWVPVAFLKPTSMGRAAAILQAKNGSAAIDRDETKFNKVAEEGAIKPVPKPSHATVASIESNGNVLHAFGAGGTPTVVWKGTKGHVHVLDGMPKLSQLPLMTGLPEQKDVPPDLLHFK